MIPVYRNPAKYESMNLGIVLAKRPGVTRWVSHVWRVSAILPGAPQASWKLLRAGEDFAEYHAATVPLELHGADAEAYAHELGAREPSIYVILHESDEPGGICPHEVSMVTVSPYEAQDYGDSGEVLVEKTAMPPIVREFVEDFVAAHYTPEEFKKRKRDKARIDLKEDGVGDVRVTGGQDVYRAPGQLVRRGKTGSCQQNGEVLP